jgi:exodeoxyribonuclease-5
MDRMNKLIEYFPYIPTEDQRLVIQHAESFLDMESNDDFMILLGSAGTGKSTVIKGITDYMAARDLPFVLSAPTAKAARRMVEASGHSANTLHSLIFTPEKQQNSPAIIFRRKAALECEPTVYIVDEASMISDQDQKSAGFESGSLLCSFIDYVKAGNKKSKIIFIGDKYQLPPVGSQYSPALNDSFLRQRYLLTGSVVELTTVMRQAEGSYILDEATRLRQCLENGASYGRPSCKMLPQSMEAVNKYIELYDASDYSKVTVLAWRNTDVNQFNRLIRNRLGLSRSTFMVGDRITLHRNWYHSNGILMKGEVGTVKQITSTIKTNSGVRFVKAKIEFPTLIGESIVYEANVLLDTLENENGDLPFQKENELYAYAKKHNEKFRRSGSLVDDEFAGAMRIRYAYAITCHKAQGSEWETVILHPVMPATDLRWKYTAITRASRELFSFAA